MVNRRSFLAGTGGAALAAAGLSAPASAQSAPGTKWNRLDRHLKGQLVRPTDADYPTAKQLYLAQFDDIHPQAIAYCSSPADVSLCLRFAEHHAVPVAVRSGGHCAAGYSTKQDALVIDVSRMNKISLGPGSVRLGSGAQLVDITDKLGRAGVTIPEGYCPNVAAGGFLQGGGAGPFTRSMGMATDRVTEAQVVLADGSLVTASPREHSDLYWALRGGGGGNFGVVTSFKLASDPLTDFDTATLFWPWEQTLDLLEGWAKWQADAPWSIGFGLLVTLMDAAPGKVPEVSVFLGSVDTGGILAREVDRLISLVGRPPARRVAIKAPYQQLMMGFYDCDDKTVDQCHRVGTMPGAMLPRVEHGLWRSRLFSEVLPREGWSKVLSVIENDRHPGQMRQIQIVTMGGKANALSRNATAYVHRDTAFSVSYLTSNATGPVSGETVAASERFVDTGFNTIDPYSNGETYLNFYDPRDPHWAKSYYAENYPRLMRIKDKYDPHNLFSHAQSVR
ncbi:FAD-binding oxidoreductase [Streptomyces sp. IB201691-2A2]|jgi:FAD/FMN-containing dehydrogenase|uniref:FAD-binding oxidoreductase n=1 Tax=Streptomyces sp. IB201691-2A2 TaxID=2561920 RepID=UPI00117C4588|nr:FAD-binding oxidoreductase [Streptomyces sp. IB201691-2A2]TRO56465.1 FAD-binding oxidoreductase [Streptomyces sp. IB201691-2A2]